MWTIFWIVICFKNINIFWTGEQILKKQEHFLNSEHFLNLENKILKLRTKFEHKYFLKVRTFFESWEQILKRRTNLDNFLKHEHFFESWEQIYEWKEHFLNKLVHEHFWKSANIFLDREGSLEYLSHLALIHKNPPVYIRWIVVK